MDWCQSIHLLDLITQKLFEKNADVFYVLLPPRPGVSAVNPIFR